MTGVLYETLYLFPVSVCFLHLHNIVSDGGATVLGRFVPQQRRTVTEHIHDVQGTSRPTRLVYTRKQGQYIDRVRVL